MYKTGKIFLDTPLALAFLQITSAVIVLFVITIIVLHILWHIGMNGLFYKKRTVHKDWNKQFYPASAILLVFTMVIFIFLVRYSNL